jgi:protein involved in polysaccharide export with SLBB domain
MTIARKTCGAWAGLVAVAAVVMLPGCAARTSTSTGQATQDPTGAIAVARAVSPDYRIQTGDTLLIRFSYHPEQNQEVVVGPDGKVFFQVVGEVPVAGRTPGQIAEDLVTRYSRTLRDPEIAVTLKTMLETKVWVGGEVTKPGFVAFRPGLTLVQAVMDAGGPKETARMQDVVLLKRRDGQQFEATKVDLLRILKEGDPSTDVALTPADVIFVPMTAIARANQFVDQYFLKLIPVRPGLGFGF